MRVSTSLFVVGALLSCAVSAEALVGPRTSDVELAKAPVMVIGYWVKGHMANRTRVNGNSMRASRPIHGWSSRELIRGDLKPGEVPLLCKWPFWGDDGHVTNMPEGPILDVDDVSKPTSGC